MYPQLLVSFVFINFVTANDQALIKYGDEGKPNAVENKNNLAIDFPKWKQHFWKPHKRVPRNMTFLDRAENMIRLPKLNNLDEKKEKKKLLKKSPKRTIQKIIKKSKQKTKKILVLKVTNPPVSPENFDAAQDELSQWKDEATTLPSNQKKRYNKKKYNSKVARYPMPFQRLQKMRNHKREKREAYDTDKYILKDFNQVQFLHSDKDVNVINAHIKKYW